MASTTKRHPARIWAKSSADAQGRLTAFEMQADFNTGAYASWGPTVANRVPVHGMGPYRVPNACNSHARGLHQRYAGRRLPRLRRAAGGDRARDADGRPGGAAGPRPLGHPPHQCARPRRCHALGPGPAALGRPARVPRRAEAGLGRGAGARRRHNAGAPRRRRGVGIACMWYGCGNTGAAQPVRPCASRWRATARSPSSTARSISARAPPPCCCRSPPTPSGLPPRAFRLVVGDTDLTAGRRQDLGLAADVRLRQRRAPGGRGSAPEDPGARQCRSGREADAGGREAVDRRRRGLAQIDLATLGDGVGWVKRSADPTRLEPAWCWVIASLDPTYG